VRLLVLSFYYPPDLSAGSFRAGALVAALRERAPPGTQIEVLTTLPNRYLSFVRDAARLETSPGCEIHRIAVPAHRSDMLGQSRAFAHFARAARAHTAARDYAVVYATSARLMTAALGASIAGRGRARLYLDLRDIFVDAVTELMPAPAAMLARPLLSRLESWTVRRADRVNLVSPGFADYYRARYGGRSFAWFTNGIDEEFLAATPAAPPAAVAPQRRSAPATVLYAGNVGAGQGLHEILPALARALRGRARFVVVGDGGRRQALEDALTVAGGDNVELRAPMPRPQLIEAYRAADVLLLHLGRQAAFERVLPSKLFEYAALGKPILAGVGGYAARFIREEIDNAAVFAPCDVAGAVRAFASLTLADRARPAFVTRYARAGIARAMADDVLALARPPAVI
jgi:glycosyltransferase involved in cell wall biosynthesis